MDGNKLFVCICFALRWCDGKNDNILLGILPVRSYCVTLQLSGWNFNQRPFINDICWNGYWLRLGFPLFVYSLHQVSPSYSHCKIAQSVSSFHCAWARYVNDCTEAVEGGVMGCVWMKALEDFPFQYTVVFPSSPFRTKTTSLKRLLLAKFIIWLSPKIFVEDIKDRRLEVNGSVWGGGRVTIRGRYGRSLSIIWFVFPVVSL